MSAGALKLSLCVLFKNFGKNKKLDWCRAKTAVPEKSFCPQMPIK